MTDSRRRRPAARWKIALAPVFGDTAALLDRLEFEPTSGETLRRRYSARRSLARAAARARAAGSHRAHLAAAKAAETIVVDVAKIVAEARARGAAKAAAAGANIGIDVGAIVARRAQREPSRRSRPVSRPSPAPAARSNAPAAKAKKPDMDVRGQRIEMPVMKDGKMVGKANAMLNLDRTMQSVLSLARRDQGEIPFALDQQGHVYTPDGRGRSTLDSLGVKDAAARATERHAVARR